MSLLGCFPTFCLRWSLIGLELYDLHTSLSLLPSLSWVLGIQSQALKGCKGSALLTVMSAHNMCDGKYTDIEQVCNTYAFLKSWTQHF